MSLVGVDHDVGNRSNVHALSHLESLHPDDGFGDVDGLATSDVGCLACGVDDGVGCCARNLGFFNLHVSGGDVLRGLDSQV